LNPKNEQKISNHHKHALNSNSKIIASMKPTKTSNFNSKLTLQTLGTQTMLRNQKHTLTK
jgi:hypothetical protein